MIINEHEEKDYNGDGIGWISYEKFKEAISLMNVVWKDELKTRETISS